MAQLSLGDHLGPKSEGHRFVELANGLVVAHGPATRDLGTQPYREELKARKEPVGLEREIAIRGLNPVMRCGREYLLGETRSTPMPSDVFEHRVRVDEIEVVGADLGRERTGITGHPPHPIVLDVVLREGVDENHLEWSDWR